MGAMPRHSLLKSWTRWLALGAGAAAAGYATYVGVTWARYGNPSPGSVEEQDDLLDHYMPRFEIVERHHVRVQAPAHVTLACAKRMNLMASPVIRAIFKGREWLLGSRSEEREVPKGLVDEVLSLGWGILADVPEREVVIGAITQPWEANVTFRSLPPEQFAAFAEPGYVKIAWTLRADPIGNTQSIFRTETRAIATDAAARARFRLYWSCLSPGILLIRRMMLTPVKTAAEATVHT